MSSPKTGTRSRYAPTRSMLSDNARCPASCAAAASAGAAPPAKPQLGSGEHPGASEWSLYGACFNGVAARASAADCPRELALALLYRNITVYSAV
jgi:hypothetical protein